jgi:hypothetical protein
MKFQGYENWQAGSHKAVMHRGSCGHCKEGAGQELARRSPSVQG